MAHTTTQVGADTVAENEPKTQSSRRTLPLDAGLVAVLKRASARQGRERLALRAGYADSGYVAVNEAGEPAVWLEAQSPVPPDSDAFFFPDDWRALPR